MKCWLGPSLLGRPGTFLYLLLRETFQIELYRSGPAQPGKFFNISQSHISPETKKGFISIQQYNRYFGGDFLCVTNSSSPWSYSLSVSRNKCGVRDVKALMEQRRSAVKTNLNISDFSIWRLQLTSAHFIPL